MKRKVNLVGTGTLTISLPLYWARQNKIKKGDELDILEKESCLIICLKQNNNLKKITLDLKGLPSSLIFRKIFNAYTFGYEEIELLIDDREIRYTSSGKHPSFFSKEVLNHITIHELLTLLNLSGIEVVEQEKNRYLLSTLMLSNETEFYKLFRRLFILIISYGEETSEFFRSSFKVSENSLYAKEITINKFYRLCLRIINTSITGKRKYCLAEAIKKLEEIGDIFWDIIKICKLNNINKLEIDRFQEFNNILSELNLEFFKDSEQKLLQIFDNIKLLERNIYENSGKLSFLHAKLLDLCKILNEILETKFQLMMVKDD